MQMSKSTWDDYQAVILAGGFGTRVKHILGEIPKPLAQVNGTPFLNWILRKLIAQGINNIALSTHYQAQKIEDFVSSNFQNENIKCIKEPNPQGTAGAVMFVKNTLENKLGTCKSKYIVLNGDSLIAGDLSEAVEMLGEDEDCVIIGVEVFDTGRYGRLEIDESNNNLMRFEEKRSGAGIINAGVYLIKGAILDKYQKQKLPISFEYDVFPKMIADKHKIKVFLMDCPFIDIGTEGSLAEASEFVRENCNE